jgi:hypothetical protein
VVSVGGPLTSRPALSLHYPPVRLSTPLLTSGSLPNPPVRFRPPIHFSTLPVASRPPCDCTQEGGGGQCGPLLVLKPGPLGDVSWKGVGWWIGEWECPKDYRPRLFGEQEVAGRKKIT